MAKTWKEAAEADDIDQAKIDVCEEVLCWLEKLFEEQNPQPWRTLSAIKDTRMTLPDLEENGDEVVE